MSGYAIPPSSIDRPATGPVGTVLAGSTVPGLTRGAKVRRYNELEGIRGIAALLVVFYHLPYWHPVLHRYPVVENGALMVQLFFVLSGFVIASAYRNRMTNVRQLIDFQLLRFRRLYPVHLLMLTFFLVVEFSKLYLSTRFGINSENSQPFRENSWTAFVQHLFLVQAILPSGSQLSFNSPAWSISVEFYTYLLFGLLLVFMPKRFVALSWLISGAATLMLFMGITGAFLGLVYGLAGFFIGCLVQHYAAGRHHAWLRHLLPAMLLAMVVFLLLPLSDAQKLFIFPISAFIIFSIAAGPESPWRRFFCTPPLAFLGRVSYSVYMVHLAVIWVSSQMIRFAFKAPTAMSPKGHIDAQLALVPALLATCAVIALTLLVGYVVCRFVEEPMREKTREWVGVNG